MTERLGFEAEWRRGVLYLRGELDLSAEAQARRILSSAPQHRMSVAVDVAELTFCDSTGLRLVAEVLWSLPKGGRVSILGANGTIRRLFEASGFSRHPAVLVRSGSPARSLS